VPEKMVFCVAQEFEPAETDMKKTQVYQITLQQLIFIMAEI
jgi:hypothetical protein